MERTDSRGCLPLIYKLDAKMRNEMTKRFSKRVITLSVAQIAGILLFNILPKFDSLKSFLELVALPYDWPIQMLWSTSLSHTTHFWQNIIFLILIPITTIIIYAVIIAGVWTFIQNKKGETHLTRESS